MAALFAAGLCSQGCGAAAAAFAGGPVIGALSVAAAALGYGLYSSYSGKEDFFEDAVEGEIQGGIVQIALGGGKRLKETPNEVSSKGGDGEGDNTSSFL